jgi:plastocyanin
VGLAVVAALCLAAILFASGNASAKPHPKAGNAEIDAVAQGKNLLFEGDSTVEAGQKLTIVNKTNPKKVGPHTFTLVQKADRPSGKNQIKKCENIKLKICKRVFRAHKVGPPPDFPIGKPTVDNGKKGWDLAFNNKRNGDSWVTVAKNEKQSRKVTAKAGRTLYYFCLVHPFMQGKIKVVK